MKHLTRSFKQHLGERGCHFYDAESCSFLTWKEVFHFIRSLPASEDQDPFAEKLAETLANYNPDYEYLAVHHDGSLISVEVYSNPRETTGHGQ